MADVRQQQPQPVGNAGNNGRPAASSSASPDRSQSGGSQASITPPTDNNNAGNNANNAAANNNSAGERALAQAQMSTLGNNPNPRGGTAGTGTGTGRRRGDPAQDEAVMGVAESGAYEALDEGGEMVRVRFLDFLHTL